MTKQQPPLPSLDEVVSEFRRILSRMFIMDRRIIPMVQIKPRIELHHYCVLATNYKLSETLTDSFLNSEYEKGRDALYVVLTKLYQFGYQAGWQSFEEQPSMAILQQLIEDMKKTQPSVADHKQPDNHDESTNQTAVA